MDALKELAEPLVDTPDSVIVRLIEEARNNGTPPAQVTGISRGQAIHARPSVMAADGTRARRGEATPRQVYQKTLVEVLREAGGELEVRVAIERVGAKLRTSFRPIDLA